MRKSRIHNQKQSRFATIFPLLTIVGIGIVFVLSSFYEKSWTYNWNGITEQIRDSIKAAEFNGISLGAVGIAGKQPKQYDRRYWIMKNASASELIKLTEYPNGTIKAIAYEGLMRKNDFSKKSDFILKAIVDTDYPIYLQMGCTGIEMSIGEYLVEFVLYIDENSPPMPSGLRNPYNLSDKDVERIMTEYCKQPGFWK